MLRQLAEELAAAFAAPSTPSSSSSCVLPTFPVSHARATRTAFPSVSTPGAAGFLDSPAARGAQSATPPDTATINRSARRRHQTFFDENGDEQGYDREQLVALTRYRQQHL